MFKEEAVEDPYIEKNHQIQIKCNLWAETFKYSNVRNLSKDFTLPGF